MVDITQVTLVSGNPQESGTVPTLAAIVLYGSGDTSLQTNATGTTWNAFSSQACKQLSLVNDTGTKLSIRHGSSGSGFPLPDGMAVTLKGLTNTSDIQIRRADTSNTQVTVYGFWEG